MTRQEAIDAVKYYVNESTLAWQQGDRTLALMNTHLANAHASLATAIQDGEDR